jgi:hypothetical protein
MQQLINNRRAGCLMKSSSYNDKIEHRVLASVLTNSENSLGTDPDLRSEQIQVILKRFESPDEVRVLKKGRFELVRIGGMTIGRAVYEPGWKWSEHVGPDAGATRCNVEHVGLVLSGTATAAFDDGTVFELKTGDLFYIPPIAHDSWVIDEPYVSLHFVGAEQYARDKASPGN